MPSALVELSLVGKMLKQSVIKCDTCFEDACHSGCGMTEEVFLEEVMFKQRLE